MPSPTRSTDGVMTMSQSLSDAGLLLTIVAGIVLVTYWRR